MKRANPASSCNAEKKKKNGLLYFSHIRLIRRPMYKDRVELRAEGNLAVGGTLG
jgi:hypothetical protein